MEKARAKLSENAGKRKQGGAKGLANHADADAVVETAAKTARVDATDKAIAALQKQNQQQMKCAICSQVHTQDQGPCVAVPIAFGAAGEMTPGEEEKPNE